MINPRYRGRPATLYALIQFLLRIISQQCNENTILVYQYHHVIPKHITKLISSEKNVSLSHDVNIHYVNT